MTIPTLASRLSWLEGAPRRTGLVAMGSSRGTPNEVPLARRNFAPTQAQRDYIAELTGRTGMALDPPRTRGEASQQIKVLKEELVAQARGAYARSRTGRAVPTGRLRR